MHRPTVPPVPNSSASESVSVPKPPDVPDELLSNDELKTHYDGQRLPPARGAHPGGIGGLSGVTGGGAQAAAGALPQQAQSHNAAAEAYLEATNLMWDYQLSSARIMLEPWRRSSPWHAGAYAECAALRVVLTGKRSEALAGLDLVTSAESLLSGGRGGSSVVREIIGAELLLLRCGLQIVAGLKVRALLNLRLCWNAYRRLEAHAKKQAIPLQPEEQELFSVEDLRGRINFGLGLFYLATSLVPASVAPIARLVGFVIDRPQGKAYLSSCTEAKTGMRAPLASILLTVYHLDCEPDIARAGSLLVACIQERPTCVLLHWAASLLAWRNTCLDKAIDLINEAVVDCGAELGTQAVYLKYELGILHFVSMDWERAYSYLSCVYDSCKKDGIFLPYRMFVSLQLAACAFNVDRESQGEVLLKECIHVSGDWTRNLVSDNTIGKLEQDFIKVMQIFHRKRTANRKLMAFEVMYFLRQLSRPPAEKLLEIRARVREVDRPYAEQVNRLWAPDASAFSAGGGVHGAANGHLSQKQSAALRVSVLVEHISALLLQCVVLFYLGDAEEAMNVAPRLSQLCVEVPPWASYLGAHGLYWAGRILGINGMTTEALACFKKAKGYKKYPFGISSKLDKVMLELEQRPSPGTASV
eukprot:TRINITY_DN66274_c0_g3_i1.p1 TRINITY_DN66274_c0_g3~~TRINITY_DN66274_c0_g3_i1.p1  ORF type:complete len:643 (-),score=111.87 TRINITY_DN66274_c0_g3_i1:271-2199(-)